MRTRNLPLTVLILTVCWTANAQEVPRTHDGKPNFNGIWQVLDAHDENVEAHVAYAGDLLEAGAYGASRGSLGAVIGGKIPYHDASRQQQQANFASRHELDPAVKCYMPGVPRANYMPYPLQIVQIPDHIFIAYEFAQASRTLYLDQPDFEAPVDAWMGHSIARWDGDTLVVDVTAQVENTWLDRAGNFHSGELVVEERYRLLSPHHLRYQATLTDPSVYREPWTLEVILYKNIDPKAQLMDFRCVEFVEELMYGHLSKDSDRLVNKTADE